MVSAISNTTHRDHTSTETPHRRLFVRGSCRVITRAFSSIRGTETNATETLTVVGATFLAAFSADRKKTANSKQRTAGQDLLVRLFAVYCLLFAICSLKLMTSNPAMYSPSVKKEM